MAYDRQKCIDAGCDDYVTKPVERERLLATVAQWANRASAQAAAPPRTSGKAEEEPVSTGVYSRPAADPELGKLT
jgi:DNA-binding response OmpR family regulator